MKKLVLTLLLIFITQPCWAFSWFNKTEEDSIEHLLNTHAKYINNNNLKKFCSTFSKDYKSADGFNLDVYTNLTRDVWDTYRNIDYSIDIKKITIEGNKAKVELTENSYAKLLTSKVYEGELKSTSETIYYLKKEDEKWKIISDDILTETTSILYGDAKGLDIKLSAPDEIKANTEYSASLEFEAPKDTLSIASIVSDKIEYPQESSKEVFRRMPEDNILERLFTSNNENLNEYIVASIGITKANVSDLSVNLTLTGFGYTMKRVNVIHCKDGEK